MAWRQFMTEPFVGVTEMTKADFWGKFIVKKRSVVREFVKNNLPKETN